MPPTFNFFSTTEDAVNAFPSQVEGRTFLITGASSTSMGGYAATAIARGKPANLILVGRTKSKVDPTIAEIVEIDPSVKTTFVQCSLDDQDSVRKAAAEINAKFATIDVVLNNAGIMAQPYVLSPQGIESQFAANHIGHFLLTNLIMDKILAAAAKNGGQARIVNHSSLGHKIGPMRLDDYNFSDGKAYDKWQSYGQSKTANILYSVELARRLKDKGVQSFSVHPGEIWGTGLAAHLDQNAIADLEAATVASGLPLFGKHSKKKTTTQGAMTLVLAGLDPSLAPQSGSWLTDGQVQGEVDPKGPGPFSGWNEEKQIQIEEVYSYAVDKENAAKLWKLSEKLTGQEFDF